MEITFMRIAMLKVAFVFVMLTGCATSRTGTTGEKTLTGKKWQLLELDDRSVTGKVNDRVPYLELSKSERAYVANGGCNNMIGSYTLSGKKGIRFSSAISTMMACPDMETERALGTALEKIRSYTLDGKVLSLQGGEGETVAKLKGMDN